ncbi:hypothetical protein [Pendulispora albinea]|uniref:Uncharacterized protein n=1 Tax=Pendulispora albinea TaxID=2741071 RepID=A0ABZ2LP77_9BACT
MLNISRISMVLIASALALPACERSARDEQDKVASAEREAQKKTVEAQRESTTKITSAQAEVDQKVAEANASFVKTREDYRSDLMSKLDDADKKIQKLESKQNTASGKTKAELEAALPDIRAKRDALRNNIRQLDMASVNNWDATKNQLDNDLAGLKSALNKAPVVM